MSHYWESFANLIRVPFEHPNLVWGIVPLYFALLVNELTSDKANYRTAIQTGFSFLWAGVQWLYPFFDAHGPHGPRLELYSMLPMKLFLTMSVIAFGCVALYSGIRKRYPKYCRFLGHTRFATYFMITLFPLQGGYLPWTWDYLVAIVVFAIPVWLVLHFGFMPARR